MLGARLLIGRKHADHDDDLGTHSLVCVAIVATLIKRGVITEAEFQDVLVGLQSRSDGWHALPAHEFRRPPAVAAGRKPAKLIRETRMPLPAKTKLKAH